MKNFEWVVPVIVGVVFVVGNIMRIINWKNEQEKKAAKRPREFQIPRRIPSSQPAQDEAPPLMVEAVFPSSVQRSVEPPPRRVGRIETTPPITQPPFLSEEAQRAIRRNRAKLQKKNNGARTRIEEVIVPVVAIADRPPRAEAPNNPAVVVPEGGQPANSALALSSLVADLFKSPEARSQSNGSASDFLTAAVAKTLTNLSNQPGLHS